MKGSDNREDYLKDTAETLYYSLYCFVNGDEVGFKKSVEDLNNKFERNDKDNLNNGFYGIENFFYIQKRDSNEYPTIYHNKEHKYLLNHGEREIVSVTFNILRDFLKKWANIRCGCDDVFKNTKISEHGIIQLCENLGMASWFCKLLNKIKEIRNESAHGRINDDNEHIITKNMNKIDWMYNNLITNAISDENIVMCPDENDIFIQYVDQENNLILKNYVDCTNTEKYLLVFVHMMTVLHQMCNNISST